MSSRFVVCFAILSLCASAQAHSLAGLRRGGDLAPLTVENWVSEVPRGSIVVLGENHGVALHRDQHLVLLEGLRQVGHKISVGLEFFPARHQDAVDAWRAGILRESEFLERIGWGATPFEFYRQQALFPRLDEGGRTVALNAPSELTRKVARFGMDSLTEEERWLLPPAFELGRDSYRRRFLREIPHLPDPSAGDRYFAAQSIWDDVMAWTAVRFMDENPTQTLVIVVGEFHVRYGGGLPDRLRARTIAPIITLSQVDLSGLSEEEATAALGPHAEDGPRAPTVWGEVIPAEGRVLPSRLEEPRR